MFSKDRRVRMSCVMIIGAGGVGNVTARKCAMDTTNFESVILASRTLYRCQEIASKTEGRIIPEKVDAFDSKDVVRLIEKYKPALVINTALPYHDLPIMDACLETRTHYIDTANYEPPQEAKFCYQWQWNYHDKYAEKEIMALLGCGFDPGVTNIFCAYARKKLLDKLYYVDIVDCNGGDHGKPFATNFNVEINIREITQHGCYWEDEWHETKPMEFSKEFDFPHIGKRRMYLLYHEELESLVKYIPELKRIRFWMTFTDKYLTHLNVFQNVGLTSIHPVEYEGHNIIPLKFLQKLLPDPSSLAKTYIGKTCIGCLVEGVKNNQSKRYFIYNICDHQQCYKEVESQAISYTAGVPPVVGAVLISQKIWSGKGVFNVEQLDPEPFLQLLPKYGLDWVVEERPPTGGEIEDA